MGTRKDISPSSNGSPRLAVRLADAARTDLVQRPHLADYVRNTLLGPTARRLTGPGLRRLSHTDLFQAFFPELEEAGGVDNAKLLAFLRAWRRTASTARSPRVTRDAVAANLGRLQRVLHLSPLEGQLVRFYFDLRQHPELKEFLNSLPVVARAGTGEAVATALHLPTGQVRPLLTPGGGLVTSGVLGWYQHNDFPSDFELSEAIADLLLGPPLTLARVAERLFTVDRGETLGPRDFAHLPGWNLAVELLRGALAQRARGVNVLLYGPPGTGKTAFARAVAREVNARLFHVDCTDAQGNAADAEDRLASLRAGLRLGLPRSLMLFDEVEDLLHARRALQGHAEARVSKLHFNQLLERASLPVLWTTNDAQAMDPAFLRRFTLAVEFRPTPMGLRVELLRRALGRSHRLSAGDIDTLGRRYDVSLAQVTTAVEAARLMSPDAAPTRPALEGLLAASQRLVTGKDPRLAQEFDPGRYRLDAVATDADVVALGDAAAAWRPELGVPLTLCFYGPPGTGKSELARYLAWRMQRRCLVKRTSDILSMWVGETEQNIARAFREAQDDGAVLVFDEVDSLLRDRRQAQHSWEATQVNEFLQQLEAYRGVVVCTTNLWKDLDQASLRRFAFKVEFRPLSPAKAVVVYRAHFEDVVGGPWTREREVALTGALGSIRNLVPGDFAAVARRVRVLGRAVSDADVVAELEHEAGARGVTAPVGFHAARAVEGSSARLVAQARRVE